MKSNRRKRDYIYRFQTSGEAFYAHVRAWLHQGLAADHMNAWLQKIEFYGEEWQEFLEQATAVWLTSRLVQAGKSLHELHGDRYSTELRSYLKEYLVLTRADAMDFERLLISAVEASSREISKGLKRQIKSWAKDHHRHCYICGVTLDFDLENRDESFTREHIWPRSLGGESTLENLLPACLKCNCTRKLNFGSWASTSIQSTAVPMLPTEEDWKNVLPSHFYALHNYSAQSEAIKHSITLKDAFLRIGPYDFPPRFADNCDIGHFFNLQNNHLHS